MGALRFLTAPHPQADWDGAQAAYMTGYDGRIFPTSIQAEPSDGESQLVCRRPLSDSGKLRITWPVADRGVRMLATSSLREREQPYHLALELARGLIGDLRNQAAIWQQAGMNLPNGYTAAMAEAFSLFSRAACRQDTPSESAALADEAIAAGCRASDELMRAYALQKLANHRSRGGRLPIVLGCGADDVPGGDRAERFTQAFDAVSVPIAWPRIEPRESEYDWDAADRLIDWAESQKLLVHAGPLLDLRPGGLPPWLRQWSGDLLAFQHFLIDFVETAKARYRGRVKFWTLAIGACLGGEFAISEEQRLTLTARLLEAARRSDDGSQVDLEIAAPWGEYQSRGEHRLAPIQFVDALARSNLGLDGLSLRFDLSDPSQLTRHRLLVDIGRLLDHWSLLGLPLRIHLIVPSGEPDSPSPDRWIADYLPTLMAKPQVTTVFWSRLTDTPEAATGVLTADGQPKPVFGVLRQHQELMRATTVRPA